MKKSFNILAIDGGGIKGVRSLYIIKEIERITRKKSYEIFDLISGTSTGGIIAVLLSIGYSADDIIQLYFNHGPKIFKKRLFRFGILRPKYSDRYLNKVISSYVEDKKLSDCLTNILIPSYNVETRDKYLFKSYNNLSSDYKLFDVLRATVSAQTYFKPHKIEKNRHIDGGNVINNPSMISYVEYLKFWSDKPVNLLSISTGRDEVEIKKMKGGGGIIQWVAPTTDILLIEQAQQTDYFMERIIPENYFRIEPSSFFGSVEMDDASEENLISLKKDGEKSVIENKNLIDRFVKNIK